MKKIIKRAVAAFMVSALAITGAYGLMTAAAEETEEEPMPRNTIDEFLLSTWKAYYNFDIDSYEEQTKGLAEAGMNFIWHPGYASGFGDSPADYRSTEEMYAKYGMKYLFTANGQFNYDAELMKDLKSCVGYYVKDEPSASQFVSTSELFHRFLEADPSRSPFVNLYPNYAGTTALGGTYEQYVNNWIDTVGQENMEYLYYDHYPFTGTETVRSSYFSDMETIRRAAFEHGRMKTGGFSQSGWWAGMRKPDADEFRWNLSTFIAYGFKSISHFCWASPDRVSVEDGGEDMRDHVIDQEGNRTALYEPATYYNWQIRQLGDFLMGIDCVHAYHSGANTPEGVELLPKNFLLQPKNKSDNFIVSLFTSKDDSEKYIMLMNNSTSESRTAAFTVASESGVTGLTEIDDTIDRENLPDYADLENTLGELSRTSVELSDGEFTAEFLPGEVRIYKLEGDEIVIDEGLELPRISLESGTYTGAQTLRLSTGQKNVSLYYTLDGSYPEVSADGKPGEGTYLYEDEITLGETGKWEYIPFRAVAFKNGEVSRSVNRDFFITENSENISLGKPVSFYDRNFEKEIGVRDEKSESATGAVVTDGYHDPYTEVFTKEAGETGWAVIDLGGEYVSDKVVTSFWNDWPFEDVIVQVSSDFKTWESLYNSDTDGSMQDVTGETGADKAYKDAMWAGQVIAYGPKSFRYIRVYNVGRGGGGFNGKSVWQEISVFTTFEGTELEGAENLLGEGASLEDWNALGGSEWTLENGVLAVNGTGGWSRALALKDKKYKNFVIEGRFSMKEITAGLVGFELYKTTYTGSLNGSNGYVVFVENGGRVGAYDGQNGGSQEFGPTNVQAIGFSPTDFVMRVISVNDIISVSINGAPVFTVRNDRADMEAGYIAIHAGSIGITVKDLWIMELDETHGCGVTEYEDALDYQAETVQVAVPLLEKKEDVLKRLPAAVKFVTINGVTLEVPVTNWVSEDYDRKAAGWYNFTAETDVSGLGRMSNALGVRGAARVWVSAGIDIDAISIYIELAESLNESDYTPESWAEMAQKLTVALEIINDPFAVQNSVGVASFQLKDAIDALVNIRQDKTALAAAIESGKAAHTADKYTAVSFANYAEKLAAAEEVCASNIASQKSIDDALTALKEAEEKLVALGDKAALAREIEKAKATDKTAYTAESYAALERAVAEAEKVTALAAPTAEQVEIVSRNLQSALDGLIEAAQGGKEEQNEPSGCGSALNLPLVGALGAAAVILKKRKK